MLIGKAGFKFHMASTSAGPMLAPGGPPSYRRRRLGRGHTYLLYKRPAALVLRGSHRLSHRHSLLLCAIIIHAIAACTRARLHDERAHRFSCVSVQTLPDERMWHGVTGAYGMVSKGHTPS